ncbi:MAG: hypothetical protein ABID63_18230 [Pseudomonadota bacterium]
MGRLPGWEKKLSDWHVACAGTAFVWGQSDCCLTACDGLQAITGIDPASGFRGRYKTLRGAYRALKRFGGGGLRETAQKITDDLGWPSVPVLTARRGDVGLVPTDQGEALAICLGARWVAQGRGGLVYLPLKNGLCAWRV